MSDQQRQLPEHGRPAREQPHRPVVRQHDAEHVPGRPPPPAAAWRCRSGATRLASTARSAVPSQSAPVPSGSLSRMKARWPSRMSSDAVVGDHVAEGDRDDRRRELAGHALPPDATQASRRPRAGGEQSAQQRDHGQQAQRVGERARQRPRLRHGEPAGVLREGVERRPAEHDDGGGDQARRRPQRVQPGERRAHDQPPVVRPPAQHRQPPVEGRPHLEGVTPVEPARPEGERRAELDADVQQHRDAEHRAGRRPRDHQLELDEREQPGGARPPAQPRRQRPQPVARVEPGGAGEERVQRPHRVQAPPGRRPEQQRQRDESDPQQHVDHPRRGVARVVRAGGQRERGVGGGDEARPGRREPQRPGAGQRAAPARGSAAPACSPSTSRLPPEQAERQERHDERRRGPGHGEREGQRQVGPAADPVREHGSPGGRGHRTATCRSCSCGECGSTSYRPGSPPTSSTVAARPAGRSASTSPSPWACSSLATSEVTTSRST